MMERVFRSIVRHRTKSVLTVLVSLLIVLFFFIYLAGLLGNMEELGHLSDNLPVDGQITNITGVYTEDIRISAGKVQKLERTGEIKDVRKTTILYFDPTGRVLEEDEATMQGYQTILYGINTPEAMPDLKEAVYMDGYSGSVFDTGEAVCLVEERYLAEMGLKTGDMYQSTLYRKRYKDGNYTFVINFVGYLNAEIIGTFTADVTEASGESAQILAPMRYIREIYRENNVHYTVHSMSFTLENGFRINDFKKQALEIGFISRNPLSDGFSHTGEAIVLYDESFIKTAEQLQKNINLMRIFAPLVFLIIAVIGFLISYLFMQSRRGEFAIMRSLGTKKSLVFAGALLESFILSIIGGTVGAAVGVWILNISVRIMLIILPLFILLYMMGTLAALVLLNRFSVMEILTKTE